MESASILGRARTWPRARPRYSARPFVLTVGVVLVLALASCILPQKANPAALSPNRVLSRHVVIQDQECRLVHHAVDKCAFVKANCPDEEAGIFSYLSLYYCRLPQAKPVAFAIVVLWLSLLFSTIGIAASDFFCVNLSTIANLLGMSESMAGVTFLALGNGSPDVFSTFAAMSTNSASLAIGELIGAACFITAVVAGSMALVRPFKVARRSFVRDVCFFIVATSFSIFFLWDGKLHLWESATMVGFYIFYVCFVMVWHWWLGRRKARRLRAASMRSHYITPGGEEEEISRPYFDEDDGPVTDGARSPMGSISAEDFAVLERAGAEDSLEEDDNEQVRERWLGELSSNMRISRPALGNRRNTHTPIRPSLVGALEFRAVLTSLQKSRNIQSMPINLRRYSDDPNFTSAQQQNLISTTSDPAQRPPYDLPEGSDSTLTVLRPAADVQRQLGSRARAVSTNDLANTRHEPHAFKGTLPSFDFGPASPDEELGVPSTPDLPPPSPTFSLSPPPSAHSSRPTSPAPPSLKHAYSDRLTLPDPDSPGVQASRQPTTSSALEPSTRHSARPLPKLVVPETPSSSAPFPPYTDYPLSAGSSRAPSIRFPSASPESLFHGEHITGPREQTKVPPWWPSHILPSPNIILPTFFPTLGNWSDKNIWEKLLGFVAAPSVFLLTVTLPVVETEKEDNEGNISPSLSLPAALTPLAGSLNMTTPGPGSFPFVWQSPSSQHEGAVPTGTNNKRSQQPPVPIMENDILMQSPEQLPTTPSASEPTQWNRWLVIVQTFTAPFFVVLIFWANTELENPRALLRPTLYSLLFSMVLLAILLTTTTPTRPPRWRVLLCFMGFAVSIAWISSIANEVVGVLKTLGVILNMSDAILGLTIFAVGNSLGDFVADITVARLGFPVMALSACFGGPMLNILLGIGLSGCYITIKGGQHRHEKHPDKPIHFRPYHIDVSTTLVISGATLLVTLVGLLVAVPLRGWRMDKTIGWGLVALWTASTLANVIVEVLGLGSNVS